MSPVPQRQRCKAQAHIAVNTPGSRRRSAGDVIPLLSRAYPKTRLNQVKVQRFSLVKHATNSFITEIWRYIEGEAEYRKLLIKTE